MIWTRNVKGLLVAAALTLIYSGASAQSYVSRDTRISLFSSTPVEDIRAVSIQCNAVIVKETKELAFQVPIKSFQFDKKLMQEHFNENYMESDKYPVAKFKGILDQDLDLSKDGVYNVTVNGILTVHGVDKKRSIPGKITISNGQLQISTEFKVACVDHGIKVPRLVFAKIAEQITIKADGKFSQIK